MINFHFQYLVISKEDKEPQRIINWHKRKYEGEKVERKLERAEKESKPKEKKGKEMISRSRLRNQEVGSVLWQSYKAW